MRKARIKSMRPRKQGLYDPQFEHDACGVGFVCDINGRRSNDIIRKGIKVLNRLTHRGAVGSDPKTGDGAGILIQIPHEFFVKISGDSGIDLPREGAYGSGLVFLPQIEKERAYCKEAVSKFIRSEGQILLGWRKVPVDNSVIGTAARETEPVIEQVFIARGNALKDQLAFERKLYVVRKQIENAVRSSKLKERSFFYIPNISSRTFSYKGLLMPYQVDKFFLDLKDSSIKSALSLVHSRYSTNTFPSWGLAQPFRFLAHNGEINTLNGNINWMRAREGLLESGLFGKDIKKVMPVVVPEGSDSAAIDNVFELLTLSGRSLPHAMMMVIPGAWEHYKDMDKGLKDFYRYHTCLMEPWDGPAAIAFTDGRTIGAILDRNGLRPARYIVTRDDVVIMASEVGVLDIKPEDIRLSGRLEPGKIFFIDTVSGRIIDDEAVKKDISTRRPFAKWLKDNLVHLDRLPAANKYEPSKHDISANLKAFGYSREDLKVIIKPMAETGYEPTGSMGNDTPHAVLSKRPQTLYNYFKQLFAQVTNPAIDPIREEIVMSLEVYIGRERNVLDESAAHCRKLKVSNPVLKNTDLEKIRRIKNRGLKTKTISILFDAKDTKDFKRAIDRVCRESVSAVRDGYSFIILSDRGVSGSKAALPALLAVGAVHQHLIKKALRTQVGIVLESGEPREVHHFALLFGFGADAVNPYLAYDAVRDLVRTKEIDITYDKALKNYINAVEKGILKILSKMGISTLKSYRGSQIFEAVGLSEEVIDRSFTGTASRIGGLGFEEIADETMAKHNEAYPVYGNAADELPTGGLYQWKKDGEYHLWNPESIAMLQDAARENDYSGYKEFARLINDQSKNPTTLRSLFRFKKGKPVPIGEVEPVESIVKRFATGAMSFGSISRATHEALAIAMNRLGGRSNTGEGGEDPARFVPLANGDSRRSAIKQVASGRFGVTTNYLVNADELQIKIAQGAKPGEGGQLPGHKVSAIIARTRYTTPGVTLISPPPHHDIYSIEDLKQLIFDLKNTNPDARISVKLVSEAGVGTIAAGVAKGHADMILISGGDGGTGASPLSSIKHAGLPWELGLSETHQTLVLNDLRSRVRLQTDGQMRTGRDIAIAAILGAEEYGLCTAALIVLGCVMLRHCHLNNCSVGVATQDEALEKKFRGRPEDVVNYLKFVAEELREIMAELGVKTIEDMIGRTDLLEVNADVIPHKAKGIDLSKILYRPKVDKSIGRYCSVSQIHEIDGILDLKLIEAAAPALERKEQVRGEFTINNADRTTGAMLSGRLCKLHGENGLGEDTIHFKFKGVAGQSFGAWLAKGVTFELEGLTNDYVGKGISGGKIIVYPGRKATYRPEENIVIGNTTFYGAIAGEAYIRGVAGERFCIRNSGLYAVIEGIGDHGCEYMTGGRVVILGRTGRNFAAGMSGGIAYIYDEDGDFRKRCNMDMVGLEILDKDDEDTISGLLNNHYKYTDSSLAKTVMDKFEETKKRFVKVMPIEYKKVLDGMRAGSKLGLSEASDG